MNRNITSEECLHLEWFQRDVHLCFEVKNVATSNADRPESGEEWEDERDAEKGRAEESDEA